MSINNSKNFLADYLNEYDETLDITYEEYSLDQLEEFGFQEEPIKGEFLEEPQKEIDTFTQANISNEIQDVNDYIPEAPEIVTASNVDIFRDEETIKNILIDFKQDNWNDLSMAERKECIANLKEYIEKTIGLENCPRLEFYNNEDPGDYAYVTGDGSKIAINEYNLWNSTEAADSISHELWHAYQHQRANMLENEIDHAYRDGFDNYISPNIDFQMYQDQFVESDAREFAQRIKDYTNSL